ncbi:phage portal protein family protein [Alicyclobacillus fastidiosus]|uniref:DUF935 family protein n=1 Tax=Alicyclobacillus fastidiosus TaxID=392011 RepID=A0ABV5ALW5_9BACL|nr:DUF935 family protein [Alicyclobacillus fastidiosus]WEH09275.1 DUF935 family protein [Alicyclobacillus fastidiosus]
MADNAVTIYDAKGRPMALQNPLGGKGKPPKGEVGFTGNKIFAGLPMDEYNRDLLFPKSTYIYDEMRRSDGQIAAVLAAVTLPIRSTKWYVAPDENAKDKQLAEEIADFIEDNLFGGMRYSFDDHLREALLMRVFGFSVFEIVWRYDTWRGKKVVMLDKYAPRVAPSIWRFPQDENYNIIGVEQINFMTGQMCTIPMERCRIYTYQREGDNPVGISMLRPAYKHWYIKDALYKIVAVGIEKTSIGTPTATLPPGISEDDRQEILDALTAIRTAEDGGLTVPEGVVLGILEGTKSPIDAMPFIEYHDVMIARIVLAQFINLGTMTSASGGSYSLGEQMIDMFVMGLEADANYIQGEIQKDIEKLVKWNFGPDAPIPQLQHKDISFRDYTTVATALAALGAGHLINPDESMEDHIRDMFGIPPIPKAALANQRAMPPSNYVPQTIPDEPLTPAEIAQIRQQISTIGVNAKGVPDGSGGSSGTTQASDGTASIQLADGVISSATGGETPEPKGTTKWRRDLTPYEKVVKFADINDQWTTAEEKLTTELQGILRQASSQLVNRVESILKSDESFPDKLNDITALQPKFGGKYVNAIKSILMEMYKYGVQSVRDELNTTAAGASSGEAGKAATAAISADDAATISSKAETLAQLQMNKLVSTIKLTAISQSQKGLSVQMVTRAVRTSSEAYITGPDLKTSAMISVGEALNVGRGSEARKIGVQGAQWSAILDSKTCPLCEELDGQVISVDNDEFDVFRPPLHSGCRCILIFIGTGQTNVTFDWKTPSENLVKRYGHLVT